MRKLFTVIGLLAFAATVYAAAAGLIITPTTVETAVGSSFSGQVATFTYPAAQPASPGPYTVTIVWGASGPTSSGTVSGTGPTFTVTSDPITLTQGGDINDVAITVNDTGNAIGGFTNVGVAHVHQLTPSSAPNINTSEGTPFTGFLCNFFDASSAGGPAEYTATVDWGDGSITSGAVSGGGGGYSVDGTHTYANNGSYVVTCTLTHTPSGATATSPDGSAEIQTTDDLIPTLLPVIGQWGKPIGTILTVSDTNVSTTAAQLEGGAGWFDDNSEETCVVTGGAGTFSLTCSHTPKGFPNGEVGVCAGVGETASNGQGRGTCGTIKMINGPLFASPQTIAARPTVSFSGLVGALVDANLLAVEGDFKSAVIDWGDGTPTSAGSFARSGNNGYFAINGTHTWAAAGSYTVTISVTDHSDLSLTITSSASVASNPITLTASKLTVRQNAASTVEVGHFTLFDLGSEAASFTATIDWGDGSTLDNGLVDGSRGDFTVKGTHTYAQAGVYASTIKVTDTRAGGASVSAKGSITVNDSNITVTAPGGITEHAGEKFTFSFGFTDADTAATAAKYSIDIDWGDPTTSTTATVTSASGGGFTASADHTYADEGSFDLVVTISNAAAAGGSTTIYTFPVKVTVLAASGADMAGTTGTTGGNGNGSCSCNLGGAGGFGGAWLLLLVGVFVSVRRRLSR